MTRFSKRLTRLLGLIPAAGVSAKCVSRSGDACALVDAALPGTVSYPDSTAYNSSLSSYYAGQERDVHPGCIFSPGNTSEVSQFVKIMTTNASSVPFAIRAGGHTLWADAANVNGGVTMDLRKMNSVSLSEDHSVAHVQPGGIWSDIYPQLVPYNRTVMGGRVPGIGVGGYATGGGINFLSRRHGFSCDNIYGYEVVMANGDVIYATESSNGDLWKALKGGSNNFGVVTRFDMVAFPQEEMWFNLVSYNYTTNTTDAQSEAFAKFMKHENYDPAAMMGAIYGFNNPGNVFSLANTLWYIDAVREPEAFKGFTEIPNNGGIAELVDVGNLVATFGEALPATVGRIFELIFSFESSDASVFKNMLTMFEDGVKAQLLDVEGMNIQYLLQPQPVTNGTNMFNIPAGKTDIVLSCLTAAYDNAADDALVKDAITKIVEKQQAYAKSLGLLQDFLYLNYADGTQPVFESWGAESVAYMQAVSKKYDPTGVFQKQVPGGYKLFV